MSSKTQQNQQSAQAAPAENGLGSSIVIFSVMMVLFLGVPVLAVFPDAGQPVADGRVPGPVCRLVLDPADHHGPF